MLPPLVTMGFQFSRRIFRTQRMTRIEMPSLSVTSKAKAYRIFKCVRSTVGFLDYVVNIDAATAKLVADATPAMRSDESEVSNVSRKWHGISLCGPLRSSKCLCSLFKLTKATFHASTTARQAN